MLSGSANKKMSDVYSFAARLTPRLWKHGKPNIQMQSGSPCMRLALAWGEFLLFCFAMSTWGCGAVEKAATTPRLVLEPCPAR